MPTAPTRMTDNVKAMAHKIKLPTGHSASPTVQLFKNSTSFWSKVIIRLEYAFFLFTPRNLSKELVFSADWRFANMPIVPNRFKNYPQKRRGFGIIILEHEKRHDALISNRALSLSLLLFGGETFFINLADVEGGEVAEVIAIDQDDMDDIIIVDAGIDDIALADEHFDGVGVFDFVGEGVETGDCLFEVTGAAGLGKKDDGDMELIGKRGEVADDLLDLLQYLSFVFGLGVGCVAEQVEVVDIDDVDVAFL